MMELEGSNAQQEQRCCVLLEHEGPWKCRYINVRGSVVTTPGTLHLEALVKGQQGCMQDCKCVADATGIFTESGKDVVELEEARLLTNDVRELCARGTRFFFTLAPTSFRVAFYDEHYETNLGELLARCLPVAGNPGFGVARWYPAVHASAFQSGKDEGSYEEPTVMPETYSACALEEHGALEDGKELIVSKEKQSKSSRPSSEGDRKMTDQVQDHAEMVNPVERPLRPFRLDLETTHAPSESNLESEAKL